jgi:hypothetical protein
VHGAAHEESVCEMVDELSDWDYLDLQVTIISWRCWAPYRCSICDHGTKNSLYKIILLGIVSGESRARRENTLRKVPVALWRMVCKCFIKSSLESNRRPRYFTVLDQSMVTFCNWRGFGFRSRRFVHNMISALETFTRNFHLLEYLSSWDMAELSIRSPGLR